MLGIIVSHKHDKFVKERCGSFNYIEMPPMRGVKGTGKNSYAVHQRLGFVHEATIKKNTTIVKSLL
jgi:hypothetical protein